MTVSDRINQGRVLKIVVIIVLSVIVRAGTAYFLIEHIDDPGWFQFGSYAVFHERAENILAGSEPVFFISDPTRTDLIQYPPGFPLFVAGIYSVFGDHSATGVVRVQWLLDALITPLLLIGIAVTIFGWKTGYVAGIFAAVAPLLAFCGVTPTSDAATSWMVLGSLWLLLIAIRRESWRLALTAGAVLGIGCLLRVNPLFLVFAWATVIPLVLGWQFKRSILLAGVLVFGTILFVAPVAIRNVVVFKELVFTGLNVGSNLWEGLGETEYGRSLGFEYGDHLMVESERAELGYPADFPMTPVWPDGIRRDRERARRSLVVISEHPVWYAGVMATRMWAMIKLAGAPGDYYGSAGFNCTPAKCLPPALRSPPLTWGVTLVGILQSTYRYVAMPLALVGFVFGFRRDWIATSFLFMTLIYYLVPGTFAHTELRYVLPMHGVLVVLSALGLVELISLATMIVRRPKREQLHEGPAA